jgi:hypothetical protein
MKLREILEHLHNFEKMLVEYQRLFVEEEELAKSFSINPTNDRLSIFLKKMRLKKSLILEYSYLKPIIEKHGRRFLRWSVESGQYEVYMDIIEKGGEFQSVLEDLLYVKGSLGRYKGDTEFDENGNVIKKEEKSQEPETSPIPDVKTMTNVYVEGDLIQGDVNLTVSHIYQTLEHIIDERIEEPEKKKKLKDYLKTVYEEVKDVGTDVISKTLGEILKG